MQIHAGHSHIAPLYSTGPDPSISNAGVDFEPKVKDEGQATVSEGQQSNSQSESDQNSFSRGNQSFGQSSDQQGGEQKQSFAQTSLVSGSTAIAAQDVSNQAKETKPKKSDEKTDGELSEKETELVRKLEKRDREVRTHEQAHVAASGGLAGSPRYEYKTGPDGRQYVVNGKVSIKGRSGGGDPEKVIEDMEKVKAAALAPAEPSGQDRSVARSAEASIQQARAELAQQRSQDMKTDSGQAAGMESDGQTAKNQSQTQQMTGFSQTGTPGENPQIHPNNPQAYNGISGATASGIRQSDTQGHQNADGHNHGGTFGVSQSPAVEGVNSSTSKGGDADHTEDTQQALSNFATSRAFANASNAFSQIQALGRQQQPTLSGFVV